MKFDPVEAITKIGTLDPQRLAYAAGLLESLPPPVQRLTRDPYSARALVYALLLDDDEGVRSAQLGRLAESRRRQGLCPDAVGRRRGPALDPRARLPLVELAVPSLRQLSPDQFREFRGNVQALMEADRTISLFEFATLRLLMRHLGPQFGGRAATAVRYRTPGPLAGPAAVLLTAMARVGQPGDGDGAGRAFRAGREAIGWDVPVEPARGRRARGGQRGARRAGRGGAGAEAGRAPGRRRGGRGRRDRHRRRGRAAPGRRRRARLPDAADPRRRGRLSGGLPSTGPVITICLAGRDAGRGRRYPGSSSAGVDRPAGEGGLA